MYFELPGQPFSLFNEEGVMDTPNQPNYGKNGNYGEKDEVVFEG